MAIILDLIPENRKNEELPPTKTGMIIGKGECLFSPSWGERHCYRLVVRVAGAVAPVVGTVARGAVARVAGIADDLFLPLDLVQKILGVKTNSVLRFCLYSSSVHSIPSTQWFTGKDSPNPMGFTCSGFTPLAMR